MRFVITDGTITVKDGVEYKYRIDINSDYWTDILTLMNVCKILDLEIREGLDLVEKNGAVIDKDNGVLLFLTRSDAEKMQQLLEFEREVELKRVEDITMEDLERMDVDYLKRVIMQDDVVKEKIVDMIVRVVEEHKLMLEEEYRLAKEEE